MSDYVFVYGRLRKDYPYEKFVNPVLLGKYIGEGSVNGRLYLNEMEVLAVECANPMLNIFGDIYLTEQLPELLAEMDKILIYNKDNDRESLFNRKLANIECFGKTYSCWVYFYKHDVSKFEAIPSGDYLEHIKTDF